MNLKDTNSKWDALLYLENGKSFEGVGFGAERISGGELIFNTGMTGYQEIFTDPSYCRQIVVMTYPEIGNTGVNGEDIEGNGHLYLGGVVARRYCREPSNWRATQTLGGYLKEKNIPAIEGLDTRELVKVLRDEGAQRGVILPKSAAGKKDLKTFAKEQLDAVPLMEGLELVSEVSRKDLQWFQQEKNTPSKLGTAVVYDYGVKTGILASLKKRGFDVCIVPHNFPYQEVLAMKPTMVNLSNGPGDPARVEGTVEQLQGLIGKVPIFAICMGHQLLARALGAPTYKLKFGHHGINHPVKDHLTGNILITSQNHGFAVEEETLKSLGYKISHVNLNDQTVEGFVSEKDLFYSVQFHPEAAPGPNEGQSLFDNFIRGFLR